MSQDYNDNAYQVDHVGTTDLQVIENNLACLKSLFSGAGVPSNIVAGMPWFDTAQKLLKIRNDDDSDWWGIMHGDTDQKIWIYRNAAMDGWAIDAAVTDKVLALKGGSDAYNANGGTSAGTWTQNNHTHDIGDHTHTVPAHVHPLGKSSYPGRSTPSGNIVTGSSSPTDFLQNDIGSGAVTVYRVTSQSTSSGAGETGTAVPADTSESATVNTWRPAAAIGTLQYLDI